MKYKIKVLSIYEKGHYRDTQEDSIFPLEKCATAEDRLFMVCDGMGGHEAGEVASQAVCEAMSHVILELAPKEEVLTDEILSQALTEAYNLLDKRDPNPESAKKMGTTMTLLKLHSEGATIAHIGDSRVYQFRLSEEGKLQVIHKTVDHSLVNDLLKVGELTQEEAENYPRKNVITRAMQSHMERRPKADISHIEDVKAGDYFLLCSDGMLENDMTDENLCNMIGMPERTDEEKIDMLIKRTEDNHDNHSAYLIHILDVDEVPHSISTPKDKSEKEIKPEENEALKNAAPLPSRNKVSSLRMFLTGVSLLLIIGGGWMYSVNNNKSEVSPMQERGKKTDCGLQSENNKPNKQEIKKQSTLPTDSIKKDSTKVGSNTEQRTNDQTVETHPPIAEEQKLDTMEAEAESDLDRINKLRKRITKL